MIPFEKVAGRWKGGRLLSEPDYEFADCERSVTSANSEADAKGGYGGGADGRLSVTPGLKATKEITPPRSSSAKQVRL